jgi:hypothetical protein
MVAEIYNLKKPEKSVVELAIAALDGNPNPLDTDMRDIGDSPTDLDLIPPGELDQRHDAETVATRCGAKGQ